MALLQNSVSFDEREHNNKIVAKSWRWTHVVERVRSTSGARFAHNTFHKASQILNKHGKKVRRVVGAFAVVAFIFALWQPTSAFAEALTIPLQEKIALEHENYLARRLFERKNRINSLLTIVPIVAGVSFAIGWALTKLQAYMDQAIKDEDIEYFGEYIAPETTALEVEVEDEEDDDDVDMKPDQKSSLKKE